ncbi:glycosyltransferase family 4 protein [Oryzicola mucosus]|uniref:glycosyltransferase family 4 protein n=1 Tax=Oryzicola mucosus TaxID=2767425 RepID=UPI0022AA3EEA|nr:glycosyltransferase family 4 protein [Oryzicola mucosus]
MDAHTSPTIVLATDSLAPSGVGEHMLTLADTLKDHYRIVLAFPDADSTKSFMARARNAGCETLPLADDGPPIASLLHEVSAAVLHVHAGVAWEGHALVAAGRQAGVPTIRTEHLPYVLTDEEQKAAHLLGIEQADQTIFVSEATHETYRSAGAAGRRSVTIRNGIARPRPLRARSETRSTLGIPREAPVVATIARFTAQKGYKHLLSAAVHVLAEVPEAQFVLIGDGSERPAMEMAAAELGIANSVRFLGTRDDAPDLLAAADVFVLASLFEGLPLVVLEAMALDLPVVATRIGGTLEALGADYPWLVQPSEPVALAETISTALRDGAMRELLGHRNRRRYENEFTAMRMASETAALYRAVFAEGAYSA